MVSVASEVESKKAAEAGGGSSFGDCVTVTFYHDITCVKVTVTRLVRDLTDVALFVIQRQHQRRASNPSVTPYFCHSGTSFKRLSSKMCRPGPLRELPLDRFPAGDSNVIASPTRSTSHPNKRPLSPRTSALYSPVKRRILNEEGIFLPVAKLKSPLSVPASVGPASSYFQDLLHGPDSPVKKLDFGNAKAESVDSGLGGLGETAKSNNVMSSHVTPIQRARASLSHQSASPFPVLHSKTTPKSKLAASSTLSSMPEMADDDCFSPRSLIVTQMTSSTSAPTLVPREVIISDPQSIHYPGFDVFLDTHDCLPPARAIVAAARADKGSDRGTDKLVRLKGVEKENVAPASRPCHSKSTAASPVSISKTSWLNGVVLNTDALRKEYGSPASATVTPSSKRACEMSCDTGRSPLPQSLSLRVAGVVGNILTPLPRSRSAVGDLERSRRKMALQDEVDGTDGGVEV